MKTIKRQVFNPSSTQKSYPLLAVEQYERVLLSHNVEFRGGFYMQTQNNLGNIEIYVPDTREVFCNSCHALAILTRGSMSKAALQKYEDIKLQLADNERWFMELSSVDEEIVLGESFYDKTEDKILREQFILKKVKIYQLLFELITSEFDVKHFFQSIAMDD